MESQDDAMNLRKTRPWEEVLSSLKKTADNSPDSPRPHIEAICFLVDLLLEGPSEGRIDFVRDADEVASEIKSFFDFSRERFGRNAEYLFFVGYLISLTDWYFDEDTLETARQMEKSASELEPENDLYRWGYLMSIRDRSAENLAARILSQPERIKWLESKGCAGAQIRETLGAKLDSSIWNTENET